MDTLVVALRVVLSLAVVLGLLWVMQRRLSRGTRGRGGANLVTVVGRQGLGQKASVVVVDIDGQRLILGVTEQSVTVLHDAAAPVPVPVPVLVPVPASASGAEAFARSMTEASEPHDTLGPPLEFRPRRRQTPSGRLAGSILSPTTWQQTAAALRHGR